MSLRKTAAVLLGALASGVLLTGCPDMFGPLPYMDPTPIVSDETARAARDQCQAELAAAPAAVALDGVTDTTGGMSQKDVARLLTQVGLPYVEVELRDGQGLVRGDYHYPNPWPAAHGAGYYAQMSLGDEGDPACYSGVQHGWLFISQAPVRPGTCLRVTYTSHPISRYEISGQELAQDGDLWRWRLKERASGAILLRFTDLFGAARRAYGAYPDADYPLTNTCDWHGYAHLMSRLAATPSARQEMARHVMQEQTLPLPVLPRLQPDWTGIERAGEAVPALPLLRVDLRAADSHGRIWDGYRGWEPSWALASQRGAWVHEQRLILPAQNLIRNIPEGGPAGVWLAFDGDLIFVEKKDWDRKPLMAGFDDAMRPLWRARMEAVLPPGMDTCSAEISGADPLDGGDLSLRWTLWGSKEQCKDGQGFARSATSILRRDELRRLRQQGKIDASVP